jgi:hypothetical protein
MPNRPLGFQRWRQGPPVLVSQRREIQPGSAFQTDAFQTDAFQIAHPVMVEGAASAVCVASSSASATVLRSGAGVAVGVAFATASADTLQTIQQGGGGWVWVPIRELVEGEAYAVGVAKALADGSVLRGGDGHAVVKVRTNAAGRSSPGQILDEDELFLILDLIDYPGREWN